MKHLVHITQRFLTYRTIHIEVEADTRSEAVKLIRDDFINVPSYEDPRWTETSELMNEEVF